MTPCHWMRFSNDESTRCQDEGTVRLDSGLYYCQRHADNVLANREWYLFLRNPTPEAPCR